MNLKISFDRHSRQTLPGKSARTPTVMECASSAKQIPTRFADDFGELGNSAIRGVREVPAPKTGRPEVVHRGLLGRAFTWLNRNYSAPKQLRVIETVTLGDKRLVAVIQADGRRFLVGGGPSGVSLLTPLDRSQRALDDFESSTGLTELAG